MSSKRERHIVPTGLSLGLMISASAFLWGCGGSDAVVTAAPTVQADGLAVSKATCGTGDTPEPDLQGQVSAAARTAGFKGYNCNLQLIGQSRNDGGSWQHAFFTDKAGHQCSYYDTSSGTAGRRHMGVAVIDATDPTKPYRTTSLETTAMMDPWESLKVNEKRQMLAGVNAVNGNGGPEIEIYDLSGDCRYPQLLTSSKVGLADGTGQQLVAPVQGHEGNWAPDGLTYYAANLNNGYIYPIDTSNPAKPKMLTKYVTAPGRVHGLNISDDGNRAYVAILGQGSAAAPSATRPAGAPANNGLQILDTSEIQSRKVGGTIKVISTLVWDDGGGAQHAINAVINGKKYVIHADEAGSGGNSAAGWQAACDAKLPAWQFARIIDISDETKPAIVSKLMLEAYDPKNCSKVLPDLAGLGSFTYGAHYCSVDNRMNATTLACGYFNSGIRVFDIRDPAKPKEIAYFNPAGTVTGSPGSNHYASNGSVASPAGATGTNVISNAPNQITSYKQNAWVSGGPDWCSAQVRLDAATGTLQTTCQDNGFLSFKFTNGVWPFPTSSTPPGMQN